jgi:hypothetical protein
MALGQRGSNYQSGKIKALERIPRNLIRYVHKEDAFGRKQEIIYVNSINRSKIIGQDQTDAGILGMRIEL